MKIDYVPFTGRMINRYEGGYGWDRADPGGPTKYGITCYDLAEHRGQKMTSMSTWAPIVQAMTLAEAEDIYATKYAAAMMFDQLPAGVDCVMMDYGVNSGVSRAILVARAMTKTPGSNLRADAALVAAIAKYGDKKFINDMCDERLRFMHAIRGGSAWATFGKGWGSRVADLRSYSEHLVSNGPQSPAPSPPDLSNVTTPKATNKGNNSTTGVIVGAPTTGAALHTAGLPWYGVAAGVAAVIVAGVAYELISNHVATVANNTVHLEPSHA